MFSNQDFCYWLQGYFEISKEPLCFTKIQIQLIEKRLQKITEPLWPLLSWLVEVCDYCRLQQYKPETLACFLPRAQNTLARIFLHVIDNSYETDVSSEERQKIHDRKFSDDQ